MKELVLTIVVPDGKVTQISCESVRFDVPDGERKSNPGGSVGIRPGHTDALMSVAAGKVRAFAGGAEVFACGVAAGLAVVTNEGVTILTDKMQT